MIDLIDQADEDDPAPPKPRKLPQQSRSRILVESVKEACLKILQESGPRNLTATQISEVSGVAMGSIYQYFPNVDAIIATIYEDLIEEEIATARQLMAVKLQQLKFQDSLLYIIRGSLSFHRRMLQLDPEFHRRFYKTFDLGRWFNQRSNDPQGSHKALLHVLETYKDDIQLHNPEMQTFILNSSLRGIIHDSVKYHPEYIDDPMLVQHLINISCSILGAEPFTYQPAKTPAKDEDATTAATK